METLRMNYKEALIDGKMPQVFEYNKLPAQAKEKARIAVISTEQDALTRYISSYKNKVKASIHFAVNSRCLPTILSKKNHIKKTQTDLRYCERLITENLCHFLVDGTYITYAIK